MLTNLDSVVQMTELGYSAAGSWNDADMMVVCAFGKGQVPGGGMTLNESVPGALHHPGHHGLTLDTWSRPTDCQSGTPGMFRADHESRDRESQPGSCCASTATEDALLTFGDRMGV